MTPTTQAGARRWHLPVRHALAGACFLGAILLPAVAQAGPELDRSDPTLTFEDGRLLHDGAPFSGRTHETRIDGTTLSESWRSGRRHGETTVFYPDGSIAEARTFVDGNESGTSRGWWEDGAPKFVYPFEEGLYEGEVIEWYRDGTTFRRFNYVAGKESGAQKMWDADGSLRANYVVRDGRRFGLIGTKGCTGGAS